MLSNSLSVPNLTRFHSTITRFPDKIEVLGFSVGHNSEFEVFEKIVKNPKLKISKIPNALLRGPLEENSGQVWKLLASVCRRSSVLKILLPLGPMLMKNEKKIVTISIFKISKSPNTVLWLPLKRNFWRSLKTFGSRRGGGGGWRGKRGGYMETAHL